MVDEALRPEVDALLGNQVRSIEELEIVVHLSKERRSRGALEIGSALKLPEGATVTALQGLVLAKAVVQTGESSPLQYVIAEDPELRAALDGLVRAYDENRFELIMLVSERAIQRLRTGVLKMFSDSFEIKRRRDG
jgi:hypothetical protein